VVVLPGRGLHLPGQLSFARWVGVGRRLSDVYSSSAWCLGDWLVYGEAAFGGRYREAVEQTSLDYQTLRNYAWVAKRFGLSRRREGLSFGHHAEVAALPEAEQDFWLRKAEELGWPVKRLRQEVRASLAARSAARPVTGPGSGGVSSGGAGHQGVLARADGTDDHDMPTLPVSAATIRACALGDGHTGWILLSRGVLHIEEQELAVGAAGRRHLPLGTMQVCYVLAGSAVVQVGDTRVTIWPGQAIEVGPGEVHQISNQADTTLRFLVISSGPLPSDNQDPQ
jgi:hypothetical protein